MSTKVHPIIFLWHCSIFISLLFFDIQVGKGDNKSVILPKYAYFRLVGNGLSSNSGCFSNDGFIFLSPLFCRLRGSNFLTSDTTFTSSKMSLGHSLMNSSELNNSTMTSSLQLSHPKDSIELHFSISLGKFQRVNDFKCYFLVVNPHCQFSLVDIN